ncbi:inositol monophosphatase family protein [Candidatus Palauibacter sp.]|uniref:inositol monophosphatase family protein n=1 Tax=Candidatus Palauibacter sp. TaxID=3101350 RepID=UPI003B013A6A
MPSHSRDSDRETALDPEDDPRDLRAGEWIGPDGPVMWVIDPLDGTTNWLHGYPCYGLSIATLGGKEICRAFADAADLTREMGGGFMAGNGRLEPVLRELWSEAMLEGGAAAKAAGELNPT